MNTKGRIVRNYLYNFIYQLLVLVAPLITAPYLARVLGAEQMGIYSYVFSFTTVITTMTLLGIYSYGNRQMAYLRDDRKIMSKEFCEIMTLRYALALIGICVYALVAILDKKYTLYFLCFLPYGLATLIDCSWIYVGVEDMKPTAMKNFVAKLASVILVFFLVKEKDDIVVYLLIIGISTLVTNIAVYFQLSKYVDFIKPDIKSLKKHLKGAISLFLPEVASLFYLQVDKVMLKFLSSGTQQVSFYDQAEKIVTIPLTFITVLSTTVMPRLANEYAKKNTKAIEKLLNKSGAISLLMAFPMMFGLCLIANNFIGWYLGEEFSTSAYVIMVLSPIVISNSLTSISATQYFTATNQIKIISKSYVIVAIVNVIINALLIPQYGCVGAAVATVISSYLSLLIQYREFVKQVDVKSMLKLGLKYAGLSAITIIGSYLISMFLDDGVLKTCIQVIVAIVIYLLLLIITKDVCLKECFQMVLEKIVKRKGNK